jgi:hypothetical protein
MKKNELCEIAISRGFKYNPDTGDIFGSRGKVIKRKSYGYIDIAIIVDGKQRHLPGHQFAFYYMYRRIPEIIDHIDRDRLNNKIDNLRESTKGENNKNTRGKGYYLHSQIGKYCAQITVDWKHISLGCFDTPEEAEKVYLEGKRKYHKSFNL